jgi:two-component system sensor histidine kinase PilS (NtrC family)
MANETALVLLDQSSTPQQLKDISLELSFLFANWLLYPTQQSLILPRKNLLPIQLQLNSLSINQDLFYTIILEDSSVYQQRLQQGVLAALGRLTASVAHEIRNPLNAISHAGQLLSENHQLNSQDARLLQIIQQHTERINKIINDILQSSKRHPTNQQRLYLSTWLKQYVAEFTHEQELSPNSFYLVVDYAELSALIDPGHLKQILDNLCHNALKYGQAQLAPIQIHLCLYQTHPCIEIIDNGVIKDHHIMNQLFEPFFTTSNTGSGLGLYLSRELAHLNQASLHYAITSDQHSCFRLCLSNADKTQLTL